ncbi:AAA family ATPase [Planctomicrobium sp. SH527]|uniref:ATP-dependent nuclease n=1 Tax=Planctomicrobium sp. SH527 TaxID=3448123 RepID=UPI003F5C8D3E
MHISRLRLRNFRNFRAAEFRFSEGVNTLIGENGSGKTNAFQAIRLLLDDSLSRGAIRLRESDFNRSLDSWKGAWIIISLDFDDLDTSEGCQVIRHGVGHMDDTNSGTYTFIFRPNKIIRKTLFELSTTNDADDEIRRILDDLTIEQYESLITGRATADFLDDEIYGKLVGDFDSLTFPDHEDDASLIGDRMLQPLHSEVSCTFVKALRDVIADLRNYRDSPLLNLLRGAEGKISITQAKKILSQITTLNNEISGLEEIRDIAQGVQDSLQDTVGHTYSPTIDIRSAIPEELDRLLQRLCLTVSDPGDEGYKGEIDELSLGGANLIYLSLKLLEYELKTASDRVAHFLLIEEPESHIHTHIQKTLFEKYTYENTQVIVSTHSTHISAASKISSVNILAKSGCKAQVFHPANALSSKSCQRIERYLDSVRSTLLFAKGVILAEGDAEMILIPTLVKKVLGVSLDELGISLINMNSSFFSNIAVLFHDKRIKRKCAILTDLDTSFLTLPSDPKTDTKVQAGCRASQESGRERYAKLEATYTKNPWVKPFYATHTFEVDFLRAGNEDEVVATLDTIYLRTADKSKCENKIRSVDIEVSASEMLRLAKSQGKGWFALLLAEHIKPNTTIPPYILESVAFACRRIINDKTIVQMIKYRCDCCHKDSSQRRAVLSMLSSATPEEIRDEYVAQYPKRILSKFIGMVR